jgi:GDP-4-dehydro-6-deoxy-D-mannose reductase
MGSAAEYGDCFESKLITEKMMGRVDSQYGLVKLLQTQTALYFARAGQDVMVARLFNILGAGLPRSTAVGRFASDIVRTEHGSGPMKLETGNLGAIRDYLDVRDICSALRALSEHGRSGEIYNVCSQKGVVIRDLLRQMLALSPKNPLSFLEDTRCDAGVLRSVGSCVKLKKDTGWSPSYTFKQGLQSTLEYYRHLGQSSL